MPAKSDLRMAMEARDLAAIVDAFAPDAEFISPLTASFVFRGREQIEALSKVVLTVFEGFHYTQELMDDRTGYLVSQAKVDGIDIEMVDSIRFRPDGKIQSLTVFFRPLPAAAAAMRRIGAAFGSRKGPARAALIAALTTPLALMTRFGDKVGVDLIRSSL
jgi:hypothetical protein